MKTFSLCSILFFLCFFIVSCKTTTLLKATFEADAIGASPDKTLPGDPSGDEITYVTEFAPRLKVQNSTISGSKALHITNVPNADIPGSQKYVSFKGASTDLTETVWFLFSGQNTSPAYDMTIILSDGGTHAIARMTIHYNGDVGLTRDISYTTEDIIGNVGNEVHTIVFTTFAATHKYNVTIFKETGPAITAENKNMLTTNPVEFLNPARPTISFGNIGNQDQQVYAIGDVLITKKKPSVMP